MSSALARHGMGKDDVLMIISRNSVEYVIMFLAVTSFGGICTVLNPDNPTGLSISSLSGFGRCHVFTNSSPYFGIILLGTVTDLI